MINILLIEDNPGDAKLVEEALKDAPDSKFNLIWRDRLQAGIELLSKDDIDLVLLDLNLPDSSGISTISAVLNHAPGVPILVLTGIDDKRMALEAVRCGAQDYLVKERMNPDMLERCIRYAVERQQLLDEIRASSFIDPLTGLHNRRGFVTLAARELKLAKRENIRMVLFFIDIDGFKQINDRFGHQAGDKALVEFSKILQTTCREVDLIARVGGDEFLVFIRDDGNVDGEQLINRIEKRLKERNDRNLTEYTLSASIGTALYEPGSSYSIDELVAKADTLMYEHKKRHRPQILNGKN